METDIIVLNGQINRWFINRFSVQYFHILK